MSFLKLHIDSVGTKMARANSIDYRIINVNASGFGVLRLNRSWRVVLGKKKQSFLLKNVDVSVSSYSILSKQRYFLPAKKLTKARIKFMTVQAKFDSVKVQNYPFQIQPILTTTSIEFPSIKLKFQHVFKYNFQR